jgi:hypothetical protein
MHDDLEKELADLIEQLKPGGSQAAFEALRNRIAEVRRAIEHRESNIVFVRDDFIDDE